MGFDTSGGGEPNLGEYDTMNDPVTLELPPELAESARDIAGRTNRRIEDVLLEGLDRAVADVPISLLPDDKVLALCDLRMSDEQQEELSDLLGRQREGTLDSTGRTRLDTLMALYRGGMVRKAAALKVAVERGLRPPLAS